MFLPTLSDLGATTIMEASVRDHVKSIRNKADMAVWNVTKQLQDRWYQSLESSVPDYSVYSDFSYLCDLYVCWKMYSSKTISSIFDKKAIFGTSPIDLVPNTCKVIDLGCGIGFTTKTLSRMLPGVSVIGTNIPNTFQWDIADSLRENDFVLREGINGVGPVDVAVASEYFEHFYQPIDHLIDVLTELRPRLIVIANGFGTYSIGHFIEYLHDGKYLSGKDTGRLFSKTMKDFGYTQEKTRIWNNRPAIWTKR